MSKTAISPAALEKALGKIRQTQTDIADAKRDQISIAKEINDFLRTADPRDKTAMQAVAGKKTHLEIIPHFIERKEEELPGLQTALADEILRVARELAGAGCDEHIACTDIFEPAFLPLFPDGKAPNGDPIKNARLVISQSPWLRAIPINVEMVVGDVSAMRLSLQSAIEKAELLLSRYEQWKANGCQFLPGKIYKGK